MTRRAICRDRRHASPCDAHDAFEFAERDRAVLSTFDELYRRVTDYASLLEPEQRVLAPLALICARRSANRKKITLRLRGRTRAELLREIPRA